MNSSRYYKQARGDDSKNGPRIYSYQGKDLTSIQQQIVEDMSQSSCSQSQTQYDEDSLFTFCQSQNKKMPKLNSTQSVAIQGENSKCNNYQLNKPQNNLLSSVNIYLSSSNNQPKPNKKRGKSQNNQPTNKYQRCTSLKSLADTISDSQQSNSISQVSFSNSIKFNSKLSNSNQLSSSLDSINNVNKRLTRSATLLQNQISFNNLLSGQQRKDEMSDFNSNTSNSQVGTKNPISIIIRGKSQLKNGVNINSNSTINDQDLNKIETTKYKKKDKSNESKFFEDLQTNNFNGATATTQPKQRKNEMNIPQYKENGALDYYQSTAKQINSRENKMASGNRLVFADERENKSNINISIGNNMCLKMVDENQKPLYKIVKKDNNIFNNIPHQNIFANNGSTNGGKKLDSAQTSVTQCKDQVERQIKFSKFSDDKQKQNEGKKHISLKRPFFLFDEDEDDDQGCADSLQSSDETHLNIDNNTWNNESNKNQNQPRKTQSSNIHKENIWNQNEMEVTNEEADVSKLFQKKTKNSTQNNKYFGVNNAFTIDYEKLRFNSDNSHRMRYFEFNCFRDKDLRVEQKFQNKLQDLTIDDDNQTDDETLDYYIEVCYNDLLVAIDMNKQGDNDDDDSQSNCSQSSTSSKQFNPLWRYYKPPNHSETYN